MLYTLFLLVVMFAIMIGITLFMFVLGFLTRDRRQDLQKGL
jgi:ABC-type polysaccharide/polyol phosphate export permease